nr:Chain P, DODECAPEPTIDE: SLGDNLTNHNLR [synthetic construct]
SLGDNLTNHNLR